MLIEVFGPGCAKCQTLYQYAQQAVQQSGQQHEVVKVSDFAAIASRGIFTTPALAIDGQIKCQGKVPSIKEILQWLGI